MVIKKNRNIKKSVLKKKPNKSLNKKNIKSNKSRNANNKKKYTITKVDPNKGAILNYIKNFFRSISKNFFKFLQDLVKAPFLFINIFTSNIFLLFRKLIFLFYQFFGKIFKNISRFKELVFGVFIGILSGSLGAILTVSYLELSSATKSSDNQILENYNQLLDKVDLINKRVEDGELESIEIKSKLGNIKNLQLDIKKSDEQYIKLENNINNLSILLEKIQKSTFKLESDVSSLSRDLESNSRLILSSSKTELSNRLYLAQSLLDRLKSGVPYSPQLKALGKEGLDPALLRFAAGGAPTLKDLEARLSARAGEQLDADRTKRDTTWRENLKKEISKYVKIRPTNINEIKGITGALLRAESSISRGNLAEAIEEISSVPVKDRGPLDAWLAEAKARQNADIAAKNLLAKTTAALKQKN